MRAIKKKMETGTFVRRACVGVGLALALAACAQEARRPPAGAETPTSRTVEPQHVGPYKVGKPYQVSGVWYYPRVDYDYRETGIASWYGPGFHGRATANGEIYDENALTAAHPTLPMPTLVRVTNLENGRSLALRINDRGPFKHGRIIDVSKRAAQLLGFVRQGTAKVQVEVQELESRQLAAATRKPQADDTAPPAVPVVAVAEAPLDANGGEAGTSNGGQVPPQPTARTARETPLPLPDGRVTQQRVRRTALYVQAGAFLDVHNASRLSARLSPLARSSVTRAKVGGRSFYRVRLGPVANVEAADRLLSRLYAKGLDDAQVIVD